MIEEMINTETIKINIPESIHRSLARDMINFEVYKRDGEHVNINGFMNSFIAGYYDKYQAELEKHTKRTHDLLAKYINNPQKINEAASEIVIDEILPELTNRKTINSKVLKFRPNREIDGIIIEIEKKRQSLNESMSGFFRMMIFSYLKNQVYEREKIIYYGNTAIIEKACSQRKEITFITRDNPKFLHKVIPFGLRHGPDELFNYLLCQEYNQYTGKMMPMSYRLCRIVNPRFNSVEGRIEKDVRKYLEKMEKYGPQFLINEDVVTCVELTPSGRKSFQRVYQGRPIADRNDDPDENGNVKFYFTCSQDQIFLYLRRFNPGEATVLYPEELKNRLIDFHKKHLICLGS